MNLKSVKAKIAAAVIALGAAVYAAPASAGGLDVDVYLGNPGGYQQGGHWRPRHEPPRHYRGHRQQYGQQYGMCSPREAVRKAHRLGMRHPGIHRVNHNVVVVAGFNRGHRARIVFARNSPRCHVIRSHGI